MKKFNFVFITTNLINGKQYVGDHSTDDIEDGYLGSGRPYFESAKKQYGKKKFKREILEFFPTKQEAFNAQEKNIIQYNTLVPNGYNLSPKGGHGVVGCCSKETSLKKSLSQKGKPSPLKGRHLSEETKTKLSKSNKGKKHNISEENRKIMSESRKGKPLSEEIKNKLSLSLSGRKKPERSVEHRQNISKANKGKKHTEIAKLHMSNSHIGSKRTDKQCKNISNSLLGRKFSEEHKQKLREAKLGKTRGTYEKP